MILTQYPSLEHTQSGFIFAVTETDTAALSFITDISISLRTSLNVYLSAATFKEGKISLVFSYVTPDATSQGILGYIEAEIDYGIKTVLLTAVSDYLIKGVVTFVRPSDNSLNVTKKPGWRISPYYVTVTSSSVEKGYLKLNGITYDLTGYVDIEMLSLFKLSGSTYKVDWDLFNAQQAYSTVNRTIPVTSINGVSPDTQGRIKLTVKYKDNTATLSASTTSCFMLYYDVVTCNTNSRIDDAFMPVYAPGDYDADVYYKAPLDMLYEDVDGVWVRDGDLLKNATYEPYAATTIGLYGVNPMHNIQAV